MAYILKIGYLEHFSMKNQPIYQKIFPSCNTFCIINLLKSKLLSHKLITMKHRIATVIMEIGSQLTQLERLLTLQRTDQRA